MHGSWASPLLSCASSLPRAHKRLAAATSPLTPTPHPTSCSPWCVPARATQIQQYYPSADRVDIFSGHCPHDDTPDLVTGELLKWVQKLEA